MKKFKDYPLVKEYLSKDKTERTKVVRYIEAMYEKGSVLNQINDLQERKLKACEIAGLNPEDHGPLLEMKDPETNLLIFHFLSYYQYNNKFNLLMAKQQLLWQSMKTMMEATETDKMKEAMNLSDDCDKLEARVEALYSEIYGDKQTTETAQMEIRKEVQMKTPEMRIAKKSA